MSEVTRPIPGDQADLIQRMKWACAPFHGDAPIRNCDLGQITIGDVRDVCDAVRATPAAQDGTKVTETDEYLLLEADFLFHRAENAALKAEVREHREMLNGVGNERDAAARQRDEALSLYHEATAKCGALKDEVERLRVTTDPGQRDYCALMDRYDEQHNEIARLREALSWYGKQAYLCRLIHREGDAGRHELSADGGKRARAALRAEQKGDA